MKKCCIFICLLIFSCKESHPKQIEQESPKFHKETSFDSVKHIEVSKYYIDSSVYLTEFSVDSTVVNLEVQQEKPFMENYFTNKKRKEVGVSLFSIYCIDCHKGQPFLNETIDVKKYKFPDTLYHFISTSATHDSLIQSLNKYEVKAIAKYIQWSDTTTIN